MILTFTSKIFDFFMFVPLLALTSAGDTGDICRRCACSNTALQLSNMILSNLCVSMMSNLVKWYTSALLAFIGLVRTPVIALSTAAEDNDEYDNKE